MKTAEQAHTGAAPTVPTGNFAELSRRGVLGAVLAVGVAVAAPPMAVAQPAAGNPDAAFLAAWRAYRALAEQPVVDAEALYLAEGRLMATRPQTVAMLSIKYEITGGQEIEYRVDGKRFTSTQVIGWDLEHLAMKELVA